MISLAPRAAAGVILAFGGPLQSGRLPKISRVFSRPACFRRLRERRRESGRWSSCWFTHRTRLSASCCCTLCSFYRL